MDIRNVETVETRSPARAKVWAVCRAVVGLTLLAALAGAAALALSPGLRARVLRKAVPNVAFSVRSTPEGAEVFIDDRFVGTTPVRTEVAAAPHRVRVVRLGYRAWNEVVDPASRPDVAPVLEKVKLATLIVESEPDRAVVFLDGERRGTTPLEIPDVEAGFHAVRVVREPLYRPFTERIEVKGGEPHRLSVRLESGLESLYQERIAKEPGKLSNYTELLHLHVLEGELEKAAATVTKAVDALKSPDVSPTELGQFFDELRKVMKGQAGTLDAATRAKLTATLVLLLERLILAGPSEYTRYEPLVTLLSDAGGIDEVYKVCEKTVELPTGRGLVHYYVATICLGNGEAANAIRFLERAVALQPSLITARISLGSAYHRAERYDDAMRQYTEAEKLAPKASAYYQGLLQADIARLMVSRKNIAEAIARYRKAIAVPAVPAASSCQWRLQFAQLLVDQEKKTEAIEQYKEIVRLAPETKAGYYARTALRRLADK